MSTYISLVQENLVVTPDFKGSKVCMLPCAYKDGELECLWAHLGDSCIVRAQLERIVIGKQKCDWAQENSPGD